MINRHMNKTNRSHIKPCICGYLVDATQIFGDLPIV